MLKLYILLMLSQLYFNKPFNILLKESTEILDDKNKVNSYKVNLLLLF